MVELPCGTYMERDSLVHRLDARFKLITFIAGIVVILLCSQWWSYIALAAGIAIVGRAGELSARELLMPIARMWVFLIIILLMNFAFFTGENPLFALGPLAPSNEGLEQGIHIIANVALILVWGNILTMTTPPVALTGAFEFMFRPLQLFRIPVSTLSLIISVAIQFIPTLLEETAAIRKAQIARGANFESRNLLKKAQCIIPLVVPVLIAAFRRADELSQAMEARGYRG